MFFNSWEDMLLLRARIVMRMEFTKERRVIVSDVIARILIPLRIQITGRPDFLRIVIHVIGPQIQHGKGRTSIIILYFRFQEDTQQRLAHRVIRVVCTKERRASVMDVTGRIMIQRAIQTIANLDFQRIAILVISLRIRIAIVRI